MGKDIGYEVTVEDNTLRIEFIEGDKALGFCDNFFISLIYKKDDPEFGEDYETIRLKRNQMEEILLFYKYFCDVCEEGKKHE